MWLGLIASDRKLVPGRSGIVVMSRGVVNDEESAFFPMSLPTDTRLHLFAPQAMLRKHLLLINILHGCLVNFEQR
jgi:hypothetical protein